jgi:hypothetical protein
VAVASHNCRLGSKKGIVASLLMLMSISVLVLLMLTSTSSVNTMESLCTVYGPAVSSNCWYIELNVDTVTHHASLFLYSNYDYLDNGST